MDSTDSIHLKELFHQQKQTLLWTGTVRGFWIVVRPNSLELVQVVSSQHRPVASQILKVVHDDGDEQVDDLDRDRDMG